MHALAIAIQANLHLVYDFFLHGDSVVLIDVEFKDVYTCTS